jgi:hypothetical protein
MKIQVDNEASSSILFSALAGEELPTRYRRVVHVFMGLLVIYVVVRGLAGAAVRPLWFDELLTLVIAGQSSVGGMWHAVSRAFDGQPPAFYLVESLAMRLVRNKELALRLPSILAFPCILTCLYVYVKKRSGELIAFLSALLLLSTSLFHTYSIEARPYSMVIACIAFALVCYQRLPSPFWSAMFCISLVLAESLHYYAIFTMIPFGLAEAVLFFKTSRFRWPVFMFLAVGTLPLIVFWPLLAKVKSYYGDQFFSRPVLSKVPEYYGTYFLSDGAYGVALMLVAVTSIIWFRMWPRTAAPHQTDSRDTDSVDGTLLLGLIALPAITFVLVRLVNGALKEAYVIAATIGIVLGLTCALSMARPKAFAFFALFVISSIGVREFRFWHHSGHNPFAQDFSQAGLEQFLKKEGYEDLPVVVAQEMLYLPLVYYSPQRFANRMVYLADEKKELQYEGTDTVAKLMLGLREFIPLQVKDYTEFITTHREFLIYSDSGPGWWLVDITHEASSVQLLRMEPSRRLYLVKMRENCPH